MAKILVIKFKNFKKADASVSQVLNSLKVFRSGSYLKSSLGGLFSLGGGGIQLSFITGRLCLTSNPLPFYIHVPFLTEKVPLLLPSIHNKILVPFSHT